MTEEGENPPVTVPTPKKGSITRVIAQWVAVFAIIGVIIWALFFHQGPWPWETPPAPIAPAPADVELYRFSDLKTNRSVNVEIWVKNTGGETARDISIFVRARNQNGTVTYIGQPELTWQILGSNETCSATYTVDYRKGDVYVEYAIEIRWQSGMHSYLKKTELAS